ncbi:MAG: nodulation protein NfeD [Chloroflexi bacterium]|nr:nodulation protein NfeD [Chloroflexota bacterium]
MKIARLLLTLLGLGLFLLQPLPVIAAETAEDLPTALVLTIDDIIMPSVQAYLKRGLDVAERDGMDLVILQLNTPGGYLDTMQNMVEDIRASHVPVIVYVTPRGGWAASAGAIITLAGHASAMTPETAIGAASPVSGEGEDLTETMEAKAMEAMSALVRSLTTDRPPEAQELAVAMITEAKAVSAEEALDVGLVDFIADDLDDLLMQLDGFSVKMVDGPLTLRTEGLRTENLNMAFIEQLLQILTNTNIVFLLLSIGVQAILIEISSPGGWVAGFIGVVCLALAAYGLGFLPVNWFGIIFIVTAFVLFIVDIKAPTHGGLTAAGIGSFIVGALVLFNSPATPDFQRVSIPLVVFVAIVIGATFAIIVGFAIRAQKTRVRTGVESMAGVTGLAVSDVTPAGQVQAAGELWTAEAVPGSGKIRKGDRVEVVKVEGLRLKVKKL